VQAIGKLGKKSVSLHHHSSSTIAPNLEVAGLW